MNLTKLVPIVRARAGLAFVLGVLSCQAANAQQPGAPEAVLVPPPMVGSPLLPLLPPAKYDSLDAGRDAYLLRRGPAARGDRSTACRQRLRAEPYLPIGHVLKARPRLCLLAAGRPPGLSGLCPGDHHGPALWCSLLRCADRALAGAAGGVISIRRSRSTALGPRGNSHRPKWIHLPALLQGGLAAQAPVGTARSGRPLAAGAPVCGSSASGSSARGSATAGAATAGAATPLTLSRSHYCTAWGVAGRDREGPCPAGGKWSSGVLRASAYRRWPK